MTRDGMPRAYLRIDPNIDAVYPELRHTFIGLLCAAHRQPERGRFRDRRTLEGLCGRAYVKAAYARGDVRDLPDGRVYVPGWDEWQEGDMTVAERMRRMRDRRRRSDGAVTPAASPARIAVTTDASSSSPSSSLLGVGDDVSPPPQVGRRSDGTNPRAQGTNPRANGHSPRQEREAQKRGGADSLATILAKAAAAGRPE